MFCAAYTADWRSGCILVDSTASPVCNTEGLSTIAATFTAISSETSTPLVIRTEQQEDTSVAEELWTQLRALPASRERQDVLPAELPVLELLDDMVVPEDELLSAASRLVADPGVPLLRAALSASTAKEQVWKSVWGDSTCPHFPARQAHFMFFCFLCAVLCYAVLCFVLSLKLLTYMARPASCCLLIVKTSGLWQMTVKLHMVDASRVQSKAADHATDSRLIWSHNQASTELLGNTHIDTVNLT